jgi:lipoprotein-anchoring transpeptidase ErfK/SrfK
VSTSARALVSIITAAVVLAGAAAVLTLGPQVGASPSSGHAATTVGLAPAITLPPITLPPVTLQPATTITVAPTTTTTPPPPAPTSLAPGDRSAEVTAMQVRLTELGFWLGAGDGGYDKSTQQAVLAFQKANGLHRDGVAGPATLEALANAARPAPVNAADGVDIDLGRQILMIVRGGQVLWTINTSTGKASTPTPAGDFVVQRQIDGVRDAPLGRLYRPKYFHGGIAVHGSPSIPGYPASHGCARVSNPAMDFLWTSGLLEIGTPVRVH